MKFLRMLLFMALSCAAVGQQELGWRDAANEFAMQGPFDILSKVALPVTVCACAEAYWLMSNGYITEREFDEGLVLTLRNLKFVSLVTGISLMWRFDYKLACRNGAAAWSAIMMRLMSFWVMTKTDLVMERP